jgi:hypothetical protein
VRTERWVWVMGGELFAERQRHHGLKAFRSCLCSTEPASGTYVLRVRMHHAEAEHIYIHRSSDWPPGKS